MLDGSFDFPSETLCDIILQIRTQDGDMYKFNAHRLLLASKSHYFSILFTQNINSHLELIILPPFFDPIAFDFLLKFLYEVEVSKPSVNLLLKILKIADHLHLVRNIKTALSIYFNSIINATHIKDVVLLYKSLKTEYYDAKELYNEVLNTVEQILSTDIERVITSKLLSKLPKDIAIHLLNLGLKDMNDNAVLGIILEELKSYMKAGSFFQMLGLVS